MMRVDSDVERYLDYDTALQLDLHRRRLGDVLRILAANRASWAEFARTAGVSHQTISRLANGLVKGPHPRTLRRLHDHLAPLEAKRSASSAAGCLIHSRRVSDSLQQLPAVNSNYIGTSWPLLSYPNAP